MSKPKFIIVFGDDSECKTIHNPEAIGFLFKAKKYQFSPRKIINLRKPRRWSMEDSDRIDAIEEFGKSLADVDNMSVKELIEWRRQEALRESNPEGLIGL